MAGHSNAVRVIELVMKAFPSLGVREAIRLLGQLNDVGLTVTITPELPDLDAYQEGD